MTKQIDYKRMAGDVDQVQTDLLTDETLSDPELSEIYVRMNNMGSRNRDPSSDIGPSTVSRPPRLFFEIPDFVGQVTEDKGRPLDDGEHRDVCLTQNDLASTVRRIADTVATKHGMIRASSHHLGDGVALSFDPKSYVKQ